MKSFEETSQLSASVRRASQHTVRRVPLRRWCILKDDGHEGLANGALPRFRHLTPNPTVGRHQAGGGRRLREAGGHGGERVGVFPNEIAHGACDELEAVGIGALGNEREVAGGAQLQNLRQRDLLQEARRMGEQRNMKRDNCLLCNLLYLPCSICWRCYSGKG